MRSVMRRRHVDQGTHILAIEVGKLVSQGYRVESQSEFEALLAVGQRPNHILCATSTISTLFVWGIVLGIIPLSCHATRVGTRLVLVEADRHFNSQHARSGRILDN